jgi:hypothetical protein
LFIEVREDATWPLIYIKMETTYNRINGEFLGYPDCCIKAFGDVAVNYSSRPVIVQSSACNGFLPCEEHAMQIAQKRITREELVNPNRKCSVPFKDVHTEQEQKTIHVELEENRYGISG